MRFVVVDTTDLWATPRVLKAKNFRSALDWCYRNGYDIVERV